MQTDSVPGGSLLSAVLNRNVMNLADRGGASLIIGGRWADFAASYTDGLVGSDLDIPFSGGTHTVSRVARLDDDSRIARRASRHGLQNPDMIVFGNVDGKATIQAIDAKFSIETAKSKQVSVQMLEGLRTLGAFFDQAVGGIQDDAEILPGLFFSPESPITRHVLKHGRGITRLTVDPTEIVLIPIAAAELFEAGDELPVMLRLHALDHHLASPLSNLLAGLYYFRLARIAVSAWTDMRRPLLAFDDKLDTDYDAIVSDLDARNRSGSSAWKLAIAWISDADRVNGQRDLIDRAAGLPVPSKELRGWIDQDAARMKIEAPSANQVRRRLGAWHRQQLRQELGPINPPRSDIDEILKSVATCSRQLVPQFRQRVSEIIIEISKDRAPDEDEPLTVLPASSPAI